MTTTTAITAVGSRVRAASGSTRTQRATSLLEAIDDVSRSSPDDSVWGRIINDRRQLTNRVIETTLLRAKLRDYFNSPEGVDTHAEFAKAVWATHLEKLGSTDEDRLVLLTGLICHEDFPWLQDACAHLQFNSTARSDMSAGTLTAEQ